MKKIQFNCEDGYAIQGYLYGSSPALTVIIAGATGVPQYFYKKFALNKTTQQC